MLTQGIRHLTAWVTGLPRTWHALLAAACVMGVTTFASPAKADTDVRIGIGIDIGGGWHRPVGRIEEPCRRVWVEPVYRTLTERVWVPPVIERRAETVWVPDRFEERRVVRYDECGRRVVVCERVLVEPAHYKTRTREVEVACGRWETVARQDLVSAGYWKEIDDRPRLVVVHEQRKERYGHDHGHVWDRGRRYQRDDDDDHRRHDWRDRSSYARRDRDRDRDD